MNQGTERARLYLRIAMTIAASVLPLLSLSVLGSLWLWQNGYLLYWGLGALTISAAIFAGEWLLIRRFERETAPAAEKASEAADDSGASPPDDDKEKKAWAAVEQLLEKVKDDDIKSQAAALALAQKTIETVAREMHPGEKYPALKFTLPEALTLTERVSGRLKSFVGDKIPFGGRITIGQVMGLYRWRGLFGVAEKAYDLWRILRVANPANAMAGEVRDRVSGQLLKGAQTMILQRIALAYTREVASAAIDLYSGRLRSPQLDAEPDLPAAEK